MSARKSIQIKTNQLDIDLDLDKFNERYEIFRLDTTKDHFEKHAKILDKPVLEKKVRSIYFASGKSIYVLMPKENGNRFKLRAAIQDTEDTDNVRISKVSSDENENVTVTFENVALTLLLNALGSYEDDQEALSFNNLTGHLYCIDFGLITKMLDSNRLRQIPSLEVAITKDKCLAVSVRTFTAYNLIKKQLPANKYYVKYILQSNKTLSRKLKDDAKENKDCFVLRQFNGKKSNIKFLDVYNLKNFKKTKMGIVYNVLEIFNEKYDGICKISFRSIAVDADISSKRKKGKLVCENTGNIQAMLNEAEIRIVDSIGNDESLRCCNAVKDIIKEKYGVVAEIGKRISKDRLNICLIHNEDYYQCKNDPHKNYIGASVQHLTIEDFDYERDAKKNRYTNTAISTVTQIIHEMLIKHDIEHRQILLYDWNGEYIVIIILYRDGLKNLRTKCYE